MRFEAVRAIAFGPFKNQELELSAGLNIVFGPNEAGKSSWHAAIFAGLCGFRRARGLLRKEAKRFALYHRPWDDAEAWAVAATITLDDGRRILIHRDLAGRIEESAVDADMAGREYSHEINHDGSLDGARWLGLTRETFARTAYVRQADVLGVRSDDSHGLLQEQLQRAAATAGADETAARGLELMKEFRATKVGSELAPTKPLRQARLRVSTASHQLAEARSLQAQYQLMASSVDSLEKDLEQARRRVLVGNGVFVQRRLRNTNEKLKQIQKLEQSFPNGRPAALADAALDLRDVDLALQGWATRPQVSELSGPTLDELGERLRLLQTTGNVEAPALGQRPPARTPLAAVGGLMMILGAILALGGQPVPGFLVFGVGLASLVLWLAGRQGSPQPQEQTRPVADVVHLMQLVEARQREEELVRRARSQVADAEARLREVAIAVGLMDSSIYLLVESLEAWSSRYRQEIRDADRRISEWENLQQLLGDSSREAIEVEARGLKVQLESTVAQLNQADFEWSRTQRWSPELLGALERQVASLIENVATERGRLTQFRTTLPSVTDREEALELAAAELGRLEELNRILGLASDFLQSAQERVHRDIAPLLRATLLANLPIITHGRYVDCRVNP